MAETGSWDDLAEIEATGTKLIVLPETTAAVRKINPDAPDFSIRIRALGQMDFVKVSNFPIDEVNQLMRGALEGDDFRAEWNSQFKEHVQTLGVAELFKMIDDTLMLAIIDPEPTAEGMAKIKADHNFIFTEITKLTIPDKEAAEAAGFRPDGE